MQMVDDNSQMVEHREKEINQIVRSIQDLNEIFKDLATMVVDQVNTIKFHLYANVLLLAKLLYSH